VNERVDEHLVLEEPHRAGVASGVRLSTVFRTGVFLHFPGRGGGGIARATDDDTRVQGWGGGVSAVARARGGRVRTSVLSTYWSTAPDAGSARRAGSAIRDLSAVARRSAPRTRNGRSWKGRVVGSTGSVRPSRLCARAAC